MKYLIFSDLHGSSQSAQIIIDKFIGHSCDLMICLGDVLYHGPRNDLPPFYEPKKVISILNQYSKKIICIQGNCDAEVDQMVLNFPIVKSDNLVLNGLTCHFEHGHHLDVLSTNADIIFYGHTHISIIEKKDNQLFCNPGSITIPKDGTSRSFIIMDDNSIKLYDIDDNIIKTYSI